MNWNILLSFTPLFVIAGVVALIVIATRRPIHEDDPGIGTIRRLLGYGAALAGLALVTAGASLLIRTVLAAFQSGETISGEETTVALGLAFAFVGTPVWLGSWFIMARAARSHPVELRALSRKVYLHFILGGAAISAVVGWITFLSSIGRDGAIDEAMLGVALSTSLVWAYHWRVQQQEEHAKQS